MAPGRLIFIVHAIQRMFQRSISEDDVRHILSIGEEIESYPHTTPYPSRLLIGWRGRRILHVVVADNTIDNETIVITVYEPDASLWEPDFKRRKP